MPLARHGDVLRAVQAQTYRAARERGAERGDRREAMRLNFLAAEAAAHAKRLHRDPVARHAEHVRDDLLRLGRVLRAAFDEDLALGVDVRERRVRLEVEVLLAADLGNAFEDVRRGGERGLGVASTDRARDALERFRLDRLGHGDDRGQRLVLHAHRGRAEACRVIRLGEHPRERVPVEHRLAREERLVVLDPGVVEARHVGGGEHAHDAGHAEGVSRVDGHQRVRVLGLHGPRSEHAVTARGDVVGVHRGSRYVQGSALVRDARADDGIGGACGELAHAGTSASSAVVR